MGPAYQPIFVVVIDDNSNGLEFLSAALTQPGVEVFAASTPEDGLELISLHKPQIVITDLVMPGMSGLEVLRRVRQMDPAIDVIVMSAEESAEALQQGATDYLKKPIPLSVLRDCVARLMQKHIPRG
ncbi:MAG TPA: response regulator [Candidatus Angelobacter sp.]|nr:response regulator [Candidatus Angelobacter sp.]